METLRIDTPGPGKVKPRVHFAKLPVSHQSRVVDVPARSKITVLSPGSDSNTINDGRRTLRRPMSLPSLPTLYRNFDLYLQPDLISRH